jgi:folate-dependent phosphoribosylglycinamide formyltransferase PurN
MRDRGSTLLVVTSQDTLVALELVHRLLDGNAAQRIHLLFERRRPTPTARLRAQWRHLRRNGPMWIPYRVATLVSDALRAPGGRPQGLLAALDDLQRAFPDRFSARVVPNVHDPAVLADLREANPDLGLVFGTRILRAPLFTLPRLGMINIHQGALPHYRGMPPGFWELYNGERSAGVTLHRVVAELDAGDILFQQRTSIDAHETVESLRDKLTRLVLDNIAAWTAAVLAQRVAGTPCDLTSGKVYTTPTLRESGALRKRLKKRAQQRASELSMAAR